jgi:RimJ/RimL family protein N-acetyltransferase
MQIETARLSLREFQHQDLASLAAILADPLVMHFSSTGALSVVQAQERLDKFIASYQSYGFGKWAVISNATQQLIGYCGIAMAVIDHQNQPEIGYRFDSKVWGQGFATEAAAAALQYGLSQLRLPYILEIVEPANLASVRVLQKLGLNYQSATVFHGLPMDVYRSQ